MKDESPEAIARREARRQHYAGSGSFTNTQTWKWSALQHKAQQAREQKSPRKKAALRRQFHELLAECTGDRMIVRWECFDRVNQRRRTHHPWVGHDKFILEGMAPLPMLPTLADLSVCVRAERLDLWRDAVAQHLERDPDDVLRDLWQTETHPLRLVRCLLGTQALSVVLRSMPRNPCAAHAINDSVWRYAVLGDRAFWPENDYECVPCATAIGLAVPRLESLHLERTNPPSGMFNRLSVGRAKRSNVP